MEISFRDIKFPTRINLNPKMVQLSYLCFSVSFNNISFLLSCWCFNQWRGHGVGGLGANCPIIDQKIISICTYCSLILKPKNLHYKFYGYAICFNPSIYSSIIGSFICKTFLISSAIFSFIMFVFVLTLFIYFILTLIFFVLYFGYFSLWISYATLLTFSCKFSTSVIQ